jgi:hypothetical protein
MARDGRRKMAGKLGACLVSWISPDRGVEGLSSVEDSLMTTPS